MKKYTKKKSLIALIAFSAVFSSTVLAFGDFSPNTLKTFNPFMMGGGPPAGMGLNVSEMKDLPNVVNIMSKMGYQIPVLTNFAANVQPYMSEIEAETPSTELTSIIMAMNPAGYVASEEGTSIIAELQKDLNTGEEITDIFKSLGCTSECDNLDVHYQAGINRLQTQRPYFAGLNLSDFIKDAIKIAPTLVPSEKPENIEDVTKKFEWLIGKSTALSLDNSAIKASVVKLNNLGKKLPEEPQKKLQENQPKITAPSGGGSGGGGAAVIGSGKAAKKELSKDKFSEKSVKKSESKSKSEIKSKDKTSKKSMKKSKSKTTKKPSKTPEDIPII